MKKDKGFTLIELLTVIVILAIIALIAVPIILNLIETSRKASFKDSVLIAGNTIEHYMLKNEIIKIPEDKGITIEELNNSVLKSSLISGRFIETDGKLEASFISDGRYCASGYLTNLKIVSANKCYELDKTGPDIDATKMILESTTNTVRVILTEGIATDIESGIKEYKITLIEKETNEEVKTVSLETLSSYIFKGLKNKTEYKVKVVVINNASVESEPINKEITTKDIDNSEIEFIDTPEETQNGYLYKQVARIIYSKGEVQNPEYFVKTSKEGTSNLNVTESCGTDTVPGECKTITSTTTLEANTWYKVSGNVEVAYDKSSSTGTIYAATYDGTNYIVSATGALDKIDRTSPSAITVSSVNNNATSIKINYTGGTDSESGVSKYVCYWGTTSSLGSSSNLSADATSCTITTNTGTTYYYKICSVDKVGNPETCSSVENVTTWTGIPTGTYGAGTEITYAGKKWLVVKDNGGTTTLISKDNIATGAYTTAATTINSYITGNDVMNIDKTQSKLTGQGLPTKVKMPANGSGTPFWTSSAGGSGYYILGKDGATTGHSYTKYTLSSSTRYYATGVTTYSSKSLKTGRTSATAYIDSAASTAATITPAAGKSTSATDTIFTSSGTQSGTKSYKNTNGKVTAVYRLATSVDTIAPNTASAYYGTTYQTYGAYYPTKLTTKTLAGSSTSAVSMTYCDSAEGSKNYSKNLTSTSASFSTQISYSRTFSCLQTAGNTGNYGPSGGIPDPGYTDFTKSGGCSQTKAACMQERCSTEALAKATLLRFFNYWYGVTWNGDNSGVSVTATNWTTGSYTYNTTNTTDCKKATYYSVSNGDAVNIGIRTVITVAER